ncbi:MAG: hypothetical protein N4A63_00910 [Vallitalea sp.]|jgi:hypothetical protein|nr:hypothetical protein [Vallitalea sp.]
MKKDVLKDALGKQTEKIKTELPKMNSEVKKTEDIKIKKNNNDLPFYLL